MAAKNWESDFRYPAIQSSLKLFADKVPDDVFSVQKSFCLPIAERPIVGFTPGKANLILLFLGFLFLGLGVWVISHVEDDAPFAANAIPFTLGPLCSLFGMGCFFVPSVFEKPLVSMFLGRRGRDLRDRAGSAVVRACELSDGDRSKQSISIDGDDHVLILMDQTKRRMLTEGIAARYQIRGEHVESIEPFIFTNYIGAQIRCRMNEESELLIAIAKVSLLYEVTRQLPFLAFLRKRIQNRLLDDARNTLVGESEFQASKWVNR